MHQPKRDLALKAGKEGERGSKIKVVSNTCISSLADYIKQSGEIVQDESNVVFTEKQKQRRSEHNRPYTVMQFCS